MEHIKKAIEDLAKLNYSKKELDAFEKAFNIAENFYIFVAESNKIDVTDARILVSRYINEYLIEFKKNSVRPVDTQTLIDKSSAAIFEIASLHEYDKKKTEALKNAFKKITELSFK